MIRSANDWASLDPKKNIVLADCDSFRNQLAAAVGLQFGDRYIRTQNDQIISEQELRSNQFMSPLAVNLYTHLALAGSSEINVAEFRDGIRATAKADDPTWALITFLQQVLPGNTAVPSMLTRVPAVQQAILSALQSL